MDYKNQNLRGKSFREQDIRNTDFSGSDLRGSDFTGANLAYANFSNTRSGLRTSSYILIFTVSLLISLLSGYIAMLAGMTYQTMINSADEKIKLAGNITSALFIIFIVLAVWKGVGFTFKIAFPVILLYLILGAILKFTGAGTGLGAFFGALALCLLVLMFFVGTISRAGAGTLSSNIIFFIVAIGGAMFGRSLGGGLGTVLLAIACMIISKRALNGTKGFELLNSVSLKVSSYFGTSFKSADLSNANFSCSVIKNTDFTGAKLDGVNWENAKKLYNLNDTK